jgi:capsular polysaccharide biosynthesis protein
MSDQPLDVRRSVQAIRRHWIAVSLVTLLGLGAGAAYGVYKPPMLSSSALIELSTTNGAAMTTEVVIADSDNVLASALPNVSPPMSLLTLRTRVKVNSLSTSILSITAQGKTAAQAETTANAVAQSYDAYVAAHSKTLKVTAVRFGPPSSATGPSRVTAMVLDIIIGGLLGLVIAAIIALAGSRNDRRLRQRDEIADAIGVPVLASLPAANMTDASSWTKLFEGYEPTVTDAWRLRNALQYLGLFDSRYPHARHHSGQSVTVLSLSSDKRALALGPQLATFAASQGVSTVLAVGRNEDASVTAALRIACTAPPKRSGNLRLVVADHGDPEMQADAMLTVVVLVVDGRNPTLANTLQTGVTILAVTAGTATAEQLARVATSAATHGSNIDGILIANPDPTDPTTGRIPQLVRPVRNVQPTRTTGMKTETRR